MSGTKKEGEKKRQDKQEKKRLVFRDKCNLRLHRRNYSRNKRYKLND